MWKINNKTEIIMEIDAEDSKNRIGDPIKLIPINRTAIKLEVCKKIISTIFAIISSTYQLYYFVYSWECGNVSSTNYLSLELE